MPTVERDLAAEQNEAAREETLIAVSAAKERADRIVARTKASMRARLEAGKPVFLYDKVYLGVDSILVEEKLNDAFDIEVLQRRGAFGWEVVQVIPRTVGIALKNIEDGGAGRFPACAHTAGESAEISTEFTCS